MGYDSNHGENDFGGLIKEQRYSQVNVLVVALLLLSVEFFRFGLLRWGGPQIDWSPTLTTPTTRRGPVREQNSTRSVASIVGPGSSSIDIRESAGV